MLEAARRLEPLDAGLARGTYLEAFGAALFAGRLGASAAGVREAAEAARGPAAAAQPPRGPDLLLDGLVTRFTEGYPAGVPPLRRALQALASMLREQASLAVVRSAWGSPPSCGTMRPGTSSPRRGPARQGRRCPHRPSRWAHLPRGPARISGEFAAAATLMEEADAIAAATGIAHSTTRPCCSLPRAARNPGPGGDRSRRPGCHRQGRGTGYHHAEHGGRGAVQRPWPLLGRPGRRPAGLRGRGPRRVRAGRWPSWSRRARAAGARDSPPRPSSGSRNGRAPAARTGRSASRPGPARY